MAGACSLTGDAVVPSEAPCQLSSLQPQLVLPFRLRAEEGIRACVVLVQRVPRPGKEDGLNQYKADDDPALAAVPRPREVVKKSSAYNEWRGPRRRSRRCDPRSRP